MGFTRSVRTGFVVGSPIVGAALVALGLGLPFLEVGGSRRSAYELVRSARNLNLLDGTVRTILGISVVLVPMLAGALFCSVGLGRRRGSIVLSSGLGLLGCAAAFSTLLVSRSSFLRLGPIITLSGGILLLSSVAFLNFNPGN